MATRLGGLGLLVVCTGLLSGCATYIDRLEKATRFTSAGDYAGAVGEMNGVLGVGSGEEMPSRWGGDRPLAALDRGTLHQALEHYRGSARDLSAAEQELELLDISSDPVGTLGSYLYSDSVKTYRTPPTERLALNAFNLLNYLATGDLEGAAVEARRFQVMRDYLDAHSIRADDPARMGSYLSGFVFEKRGEGDRALRYYEEALAPGNLSSLEDPIRRLAPLHPYRGPRLTTLLARQPEERTAPSRPTEILVVISLGRVPHREAQRMPVGAAVGIAGAYLTRDFDWLKYGVTKWVAYPELVGTPSSLGTPRVTVDGASVEVEPLADLGHGIRREYEASKPQILAAALARMATRAAMAEGVRAAGRKENNALGDILSILFESAMTALDRPDTRSWTTLPDHVLVARLPVTPGRHEVEIDFGAPGGRRTTIDVAGGSFATVVVTEPR